MEAIRLGLVGAGGMARNRAAFAAMEACKLTALAARNARTGAELAQRYEVELLAHNRADLDGDLEAIRTGLGAEVAAAEGRRVALR